MRSLTLIFLFELTLVSVNGRTILKDLDDGSLVDGFSWSIDDDRWFGVDDSKVPVTEIGGFAYPVDILEKDRDEHFGELSVADDKYEKYSLMGCRDGECELRFKLWKMKGQFVVEHTSQGIEIELNAFGTTLFSHLFKMNGNMTLRVKTNKFPKWFKKLLKGDMKIEISDVDLDKKRICVQIRIKLRRLGTLKWPRHSPHCFKL